MKRPNTLKLIAKLNWHLENDVMTGAERQVLVDAITLLHNIEFTQIERDNDNEQIK